jgi:pimeloyl-ACP methyl ester carboxylesterase
MKPTGVYIHGLDTSSRGTKGVFFAEKYPEVLREDYFGPFEDRMAKLHRVLAGAGNLVLVGSSYGGLMAAVFALYHADRVRRIILLAPALTLPEFEPCLSMRSEVPAVVYHGIHDDVVPPAGVEAICRRVFARLDYFSVDDDHMLHKTFRGLDWDALLGAADGKESAR